MATGAAMFGLGMVVTSAGVAAHSLLQDQEGPAVLGGSAEDQEVLHAVMVHAHDRPANTPCWAATD